MGVFWPHTFLPPLIQGANWRTWRMPQRQVHGMTSGQDLSTRCPTSSANHGYKPTSHHTRTGGYSHLWIPDMDYTIRRPFTHFIDRCNVIGGPINPHPACHTNEVLPRQANWIIISQSYDLVFLIASVEWLTWKTNILIFSKLKHRYNIDSVIMDLLLLPQSQE